MYDKITALYCRYSRDDGQEEENASITHQRELLKEYAENNGYTNLRYYADDGYSGTNFDRPDFQRMLEDIENGLIGTVIVKDMSRFGRNYILVGQYVELVLPMYDVKVIGVTDNYDSTKENNDLFAFESIFAEMYAADISKKVTAYKRNKGMNGGVVKTRPVYGYKLAPNTKDKWIIDEKAAGIVHMIFDKFVNEEMTEYQIANYLRKNRVLTTSAYIGSKLCDTTRIYAWSAATVKRMLEMAEYAGDTVNFKSRTISFKTKQRIRLPKSEWLVFRDTHPPIIPREMFDKAQKRLNRKREPFDERVHEYDTYFRKKCCCAECKTNLIIYIPTGAEGIAFNCKNFLHYKICNSHHVREMTLRNMFRDQMIILQKALIETPDEIERKLGIAGLSEMQTEITEANERLTEINDFIRGLFESKINGEISQEDFTLLSQRYSDEKNLLQNKINQLAEAISLGRKNYSAVRETIDYIKECDFSVITEEMCDVLIEKAVVGDFQEYGKCNYGRQSIEFYICNLGTIGSLVDVSYKTYTEKIKGLIPQLWKNGRVYFNDVCNELGSTFSIIQKALLREGTTFSDIMVRAKTAIIEEALAENRSIEELCEMLDIQNTEHLNAFCRSNFGTCYSKLMKKRK